MHTDSLTSINLVKLVAGSNERKQILIVCDRSSYRVRDLSRRYVIGQGVIRTWAISTCYSLSSRHVQIEKKVTSSITFINKSPGHVTTV